MTILAQVTWPWAQPLNGSISLKFLLETTSLKSESFELLIGFLAVLVQKLWQKKCKNDNLTKNWSFYPKGRSARGVVK